MNPELYSVIKQICEEKQISEESVVATVELALAAAYRKDFADKLQNISVTLEPQSGQFEVFDVKEVVPDVSDEIKEEALKLARQKKKAALFMPGGHDEEVPQENLEEVDLNDDAKLIEEGKVLLKFNPRTQIGITDAKKEFKKIKIGGEYKIALEVPSDFGRMAAQTAKQVIIQRIREAERETVFDEYKNREGEMVTGVVQRVEGSVVMIDIGKVNALLPYREQIPGENYRIGQRVKILILSVEMTPKGPEIVVSRTHKDLVRKLFELEVPEMETGTVELKSVSREPGSRSKIAVTAHEDNIDPIGSCVGQRGARVTAVIDELGGEKIDIISWDKDDTRFIAAALAPAKVDEVEVVDKENKVARVRVKGDQQSLAIGKGGQNVRLAAKLTGWKIDIVQGDSPEGEETGEEGESSGDKDAKKGKKKKKEEKEKKSTKKLDKKEKKQEKKEEKEKKSKKSSEKKSKKSKTGKRGEEKKEKKQNKEGSKKSSKKKEKDTATDKKSEIEEEPIQESSVEASGEKSQEDKEDKEDKKEESKESKKKTSKESGEDKEVKKTDEESVGLKEKKEKPAKAKNTKEKGEKEDGEGSE